MPWVDYRKLCEKLDIIEVLSWMDWHATVHRGDYLRGSCPLCSTSGPQEGREFSVHWRRKLFRCFRCKEGGNILDLWSRYYKTDLLTAANQLSEHLRCQSNVTSSNSQSQRNRPSN
jgi:DNA primase